MSNIIDILYEKKIKCIHAGNFKSRWLIQCLKNKFSSKPEYCYKICDKYEPKKDTE